MSAKYGECIWGGILEGVDVQTPRRRKLRYQEVTCQLVLGPDPWMATLNMKPVLHGFKDKTGITLGIVWGLYT